MYSFVQVRASMPFFWDQPSLGDIQLKGSVRLSLRPFLQHFEMLREDYNGGQTLCLNLVKQENNKNENMLKSRYEEMVVSCGLSK